MNYYQNMSKLILFLNKILSIYALTYSTAKHPIGSVAYIGGAGMYFRDGHYFIMTVSHMAKNLNETIMEFAPGDGVIGVTAYSDKPPDIALIDTGTDPLPLQMRVSNNWNNAQIVKYQDSDIKKGSMVCHSGWSANTQKSDGYRCGTLAYDCLYGASACAIKPNSGEKTIVDGNDSGGPVWWYHPGGIKLIGFIYSKSINEYGYFIPVWVYIINNWENVLEGYKKGTGGCLLLESGCQIMP